MSGAETVYELLEPDFVTVSPTGGIESIKGLTWSSTGQFPDCIEYIVELETGPDLPESVTALDSTVNVKNIKFG
jgi:hypothetical protein